MIGIKAKCENVLYEQVDKRTARKIYNNGGGIAISGSKERKIDLYPIYDCDGLLSFDSLVNSWTFYNKQYYGYPQFFKVVQE